MIKDLFTRRSYTTYSIACFVVWGVVLAIAAADGSHRLDKLLPVFGGFCIGWLSATIARFVYPPPRSRRAA